MFKTMDDFFCLWETEREATLKVFNALSDAALDQKVAEDGRSIYTLAWHIVTTLGQMMAQAQLKIDAPHTHKGELPHEALKICEAYEHMSDALARELKKHWTDPMLAERVPMFGDKWPRSGVLLALITHQIHHRGQLTVLMRQAGLKVPGIYGPAREEWAAMGMQPMA